MCAFTLVPLTDPQGAGSFGAFEWRVAEITDPSAPNHDPTDRFKLEWNAEWVSGELTVFSDTIAIPAAAVRSGRTYRARVRHRDNTGRWSHWSAPVEFTTTLPDISDYLNGLVISEFMYHPADPTAAEFAAGFPDDGCFEFLELMNVGATTLDLTDLRFTKGVDFDFLGAAITTLAPGEIALVVSDAAAFAMRYGAGLPVAGQWESGDQLANNGEQLKLSFGGGDPIRDFVYDDAPPWPSAPDGAGPSLTLVDPGAVPDHALPASWRASFAPQGTPGTSESGSSFASWLAAQGSPDPLAPFESSSLSHLLAFALGADLVANPESALPQYEIVEVGGEHFPALRYRRRNDAHGLAFTVEVSSDLLSWQSGPAFTAPAGPAVENGDGTVTVTVRSLQPLGAEPRLFLRLSVRSEETEFERLKGLEQQVAARLRARNSRFAASDRLSRDRLHDRDALR